MTAAYHATGLARYVIDRATGLARYVTTHEET